jgi:pentatricopeptide repeat protein
MYFEDPPEVTRHSVSTGRALTTAVERYSSMFSRLVQRSLHRSRVCSLQLFSTDANEQLLAALAKSMHATIPASKVLQIWQTHKPSNAVASPKAFGMLLYSLAQKGAGTAALDVFDQFKQAGHKPDIRIYNSLIKACAQDRTKAFELLAEMERAGFARDSYTYVALMKAEGCAGGQPQHALKLLQEALSSDVKADHLTLYNVALRACATGGLKAEAKQLLAQMSDHGATPNLISYAAVIRAHGASCDMVSACTLCTGHDVHSCSSDKSQ